MNGMFCKKQNLIKGTRCKALKIILQGECVHQTSQQST